MNPTYSRILASLLLAVTADLSFAQEELNLNADDLLAEVDCETVATEVYQQLTADKATVLTIVEDAINRHSGCAPLIVATAIEATEATTDPALLKQIVMLGVQLAEDQATDIAQEAVLVAPDSADTVRAAFTDAFDVIAAAKSKPDVKDGPKSEWEVRTNEVETEMPTSEEETMEESAVVAAVPEPAPILTPDSAPELRKAPEMAEVIPASPEEDFTVPLPESALKMEIDAEPTIAFIDEEPPAEVAMKVGPDFPREAVLPEPKPLNPTTTQPVSMQEEPAVLAITEDPIAEDSMVVGVSADQPILWAGEKSAESPVAEGMLVESASRESVNTLETSEKSISPSTEPPAGEREPSNPYAASKASNYETPWQRDVSAPPAPVDMESNYRVGLRESFGHERHSQVGGVAYVQPTRSAIRRVNQEPRSAIKRVIPFSENRKRRSFAASAIVRGVPMSPTNP